MLKIFNVAVYIETTTKRKKKRKKNTLKLALFYEVNLITVMPVCIKVKVAAMKPHKLNQNCFQSTMHNHYIKFNLGVCTSHLN